MGIKEGQEVQAKGTHIMFNKTKADISPTLKKEIPIQVYQFLGHLTDRTKIQLFMTYYSLKN
jgi:hypothetical protein